MAEISSVGGVWIFSGTTQYKMTEKWQTLQGYIIHILQHFTTKLRNITNVVILFQAVMNFLSRLVSRDQNVVH
jgi:hypothetical protein